MTEARREGRTADGPTAINDAILGVLSPKIREMVERANGASGEAGAGARETVEPSGNAYVSCRTCRDTGWIPTPAGSKRCPHAVAEDRRIRLEHHIKESGTGELGRTQTFETFDAAACADPDTVRASEFLKRLAANPNHARDEGLSRRKGLLVTGHTGSGKSHLLRATTVAARENGIFAVFIESYKLMRRVHDSYSPRPFPAPGEKPRPTASEVLDNLSLAELVCLDDLGAEPATDHNLQILYELLDTLTARGRTVVISTNLSPEELRKNYGERIFSRLSELARIVELRAEKDHRAL